ncbi:MAG TPA: T9SS type A sorting domain-containing protein, partial [Segetibacter sp.]
AGIVIHFNIDPPPSVNFGDTLRSVANIYPVATDLTPLDNTSAMLQEVVGSYDPNDKTENHAGSVKVAQVQQGEDLQYTIRFQNTGTDTAFNVFIRDTLSNKVDWNTLKIISSSHNFQLTVNEGNKCSWAFKNINLVDSNKNELLSHGYIVYSVEAKTSLVAGETIDNTAHIYFDYNLPVQTNTERTTVENRALPVKLVTFTAKRSGRTNVLQWLTNNEINLDRFEIERSENGATFTRIGSVKAGVNKYTFTDNTPAKTINYYRLKMLDKDGKFEYSAVRTVNNSSSFYVSIYPNPVTEKLIVQTDSDKETAIQLQVIGMDGKLMLQKQTKIHAGQNVQTVDVSAMQAGSYLLKIVQSDKETSVIKFQKF